MHRKFRESLDTAEGHSEFIIVVVVDIRGFSAFSKRHESPDTAMYIKRVYMRLIDDYFTTASFYKSTGDGLLVTIPYGESTLKEVASNTIKSCLSCYGEFEHICDNDPMINFDVPSKIGIGIARGTACCLKSDGLILDYSGHILNLASRLMNLARPSGIVIDGDFVIELLDEEDQALFEEKEAYLRSIAEESPKTVYILKETVDIPSEYLQPLKIEQWESIEQERTIREWKAFAPSYLIDDLKNCLRRSGAIKVTVTYPKKVRGKFDTGVVTHHDFKDFKYEEVAGQPRVRINMDKMLEILKRRKIPSSKKVELRIVYLPKIV